MVSKLLFLVRLTNNHSRLNEFSPLILFGYVKLPSTFFRLVDAFQFKFSFKIIFDVFFASNL